MPDARVDIDRLAAIIENLAEQLAAARDALVELSAEARRPPEGPGADRNGHAVSPSAFAMPRPAGTEPAAMPGAPVAVPAPAVPAPAAGAPAAVPAGVSEAPGGVAAVPAPVVVPAPTAHDAPLAGPPDAEVDPWTPHPAGAWRPERIGTDPRLEDEDAPPEAAPPEGTMVPRAQVASLQGVPLLSAGLVESVIGPIADLPELDAIEARIGRFHGVGAVTVHRLEGSDALLLIELEHPIPLADMLREDLGRPVASCRLAEGRIVVELAPE